MDTQSINDILIEFKILWKFSKLQFNKMLWLILRHHNYFVCGKLLSYDWYEWIYTYICISNDLEIHRKFNLWDRLLDCYAAYEIQYDLRNEEIYVMKWDHIGFQLKKFCNILLNPFLYQTFLWFAFTQLFMVSSLVLGNYMIRFHNAQRSNI